jgi:bifunctional DNase/RNase
VTADPTNNQFLMLLVDDVGGRMLPIVIGQWEAQSIAWNIQGITMQRPLTHDLFRSFMEGTDIKLNHVVITSLKENTFYATIELDKDGETMDLDSRPSDAVAIALRMSAPIYVEEVVFEKAAVKVDPEMTQSENRLEQLTKELDSAVEEENYERAAELRDKIKGLQSDDADKGGSDGGDVV